MKSTSVLATATKKVNDFYASNAAIFFFMSATTIFASVQIIIYSLNLMEVNGHTIDSISKG